MGGMRDGGFIFLVSGEKEGRGIGFTTFGRRRRGGGGGGGGAYFGRVFFGGVFHILRVDMLLFSIPVGGGGRGPRSVFEITLTPLATSPIFLRSHATNGDNVSH